MRDQIAELVIPNAGQSFNTTDLNDLLKPGVYVCLKNETPIYIGMGKNLLLRIAGRHHKRQILSECDKVLLYPCVSEYAAKVLERILISNCMPKHNEKLKHSEALYMLGINRLKQYAKTMLT